jgi:V8-like Glu-specific endopeptidase
MPLARAREPIITFSNYLENITMMKRPMYAALLAGATVCGCAPEVETSHDMPRPDGVISQASQCGATSDFQDVERYDGTLGVTRAFSDMTETPVVQLQWRNDLAARWANPGDVSGVRWCSGTLLRNNMILTAGHCFDLDTNGWTYPRDAANNPISLQQTAREMVINFNYQRRPDGTLRPGVTFDITNLVEHRRGGLDYAIVTVAGDPGEQFGTNSIADGDAAVGDMLAITGHPAGRPKQIEAGAVSALSGSSIRYNTLDTLGGNSGSGILLASTGEVVGVHTNGGCDDPNTLYNYGVRLSSLLANSPVLAGLNEGFDLDAGFWASEEWLVGDFDGDGVGEPLLVYGAPSGKAKVFMYEMNGRSPKRTLVQELDANFWDSQRWLTGDTDGDGLDELLLVYEAEAKATVWTYELRNGSFTRTMADRLDAGFWDSQRWLTANVDGGTDDELLLVYEGEGKATVWTYAASGSTFSRLGAQRLDASFWADQEWLGANVNGTGGDELVLVYGTAEREATVWTYKFSAGSYTRMGAQRLDNVNYWAGQRWMAANIDGDAAEELVLLYGIPAGDATAMYFDYGTTWTQAFAQRLPGVDFAGDQRWLAGDVYSDTSDEIVLVQGNADADATLNAYFHNGERFSAL